MFLEYWLTSDISWLWLVGIGVVECATIGLYRALRGDGVLPADTIRHFRRRLLLLGPVGATEFGIFLLTGMGYRGRSQQEDHQAGRPSP